MEVDAGEDTVIQLVYQHNPDARRAAQQPRNGQEALDWLNEGNRRFAALRPSRIASGTGAASSMVIDSDLGFGIAPGVAPEQRPFGIVLGCADARVPIELIFGQSVNDLFVVRMAGNTVGSDGLGSIDYAVGQFPSVRIAAVLGHTVCGAVSAAVDVFQNPTGFLELAASLPLRSLVDRILVMVRASAEALEEAHGNGVREAPGYRSALIQTSVGLNAAYAAYSLRAEFAGGVGSDVLVVWGVYDLATRSCGAPGVNECGLAVPPQDVEGFRVLALNLAKSPQTMEFLR
jgi:carbonic anhydrase